MNCRAGIALVDSGCIQTLAREGSVKPDRGGKVVLIRCVHGDVKKYPTGEDRLAVKGERCRMRMGIAPRLPYDVILGQDWPFFKEVVKEGDLERDCLEGEEDDRDRQGMAQEQRADATLGKAWERAKRGRERLRAGQD